MSVDICDITCGYAARHTASVYCRCRELVFVLQV